MNAEPMRAHATWKAMRAVARERGGARVSARVDRWIDLLGLAGRTRTSDLGGRQEPTASGTRFRLAADRLGPIRCPGADPGRPRSLAVGSQDAPVPGPGSDGTRCPYPCDARGRARWHPATSRLAVRG